MSNFPQLETDPNEDDVIVDALLTEVAANQNSDDEAFLESIEIAIDMEDILPLPTASSGKIRPIAVSAAIAAGIAAALFAIIGITSLDEPPVPFSIGINNPIIHETPDILNNEVAVSIETTKSADGEPTIDPSLMQPLDIITNNPIDVTPEPLNSVPVSKIAKNYALRLQETVKKADEAALRGYQLLANGDYQGSIDQFRAALDLLPDAPMTEPRKKAYVRQFVRASNRLATDRAQEGRYPEAIALVEEVLQPSNAPYDIQAMRLLEQLNDPGYYSPALTPSHLERVRRVKLALKTSQGYIDLGDLDRADREYHKKLSDDPYNIAARRGQENNERHRMSYYDAAYNHTRTKMLRQVAPGWESPIPSGIDQTRSTNHSIFKNPDSGLSASTNTGDSITSYSTFGRINIESKTKTADTIIRRPLPIHPGHPARTGLVIPLPDSRSQSQYNTLIDNPWASPLTDPLSTFSTDVDTASWTNLRAMIRDGAALMSIPRDAVRIEEMLNYFDWNYPQPKGEQPFSLTAEAAPCPWNPKHALMRVGLQGVSIARTDRPAANLVFLLDVSGSMNEPNKLPLVKQAIALLVEELNAEDNVTMVVYAGAEGVALPPTSGRDQESILSALNRLESGGSTNGGAGIKLAYRLAKDQFVEEGINRVILCTDGDFNMGLTGTKELISLVEEKAKDGTYLSVLGFGQSNLNDAMLEEVTNRGNGNYFHIDGIKEARKVLLSDLMGTLVTIAKDVKIQVEFNPAKVAKYRLLGYANRKLAPEDFANDEIDAGEIGSGHTVTALYEIIPGVAAPLTPELRYQKEAAPAPAKKIAPSDELALLKLRYKRPSEDQSILMTETVLPPKMIDSLTSHDFHFAAAVGLFGMILRDHEDATEATLSDVIALAQMSAVPDAHDYRAEFIELVQKLSTN